MAYSLLIDANDLRRIALSGPGAEEASRTGAADFRVGGRSFATLAAKSKGYGNLMLTLEQQSRLRGRAARGVRADCRQSGDGWE